ncbi:hypothetical protein F4778DRAFT_794280 [Xylariomycetidae sp. FL2044]|nr:hypothetical protein F4778DRAFT_794280 [Xylariomycetidae sp. FL2044]
MASPQVVLITGGNNGIGYETVKAFLLDPKPYHIILGSRSVEKGKAAIETLRKECESSSNTVQLLHLELCSDDSIEKAYEEVQQGVGRLDVLINNAGASFQTEYELGKISLRDCYNKAYDVNVTGAHVLTHTLMPLLLKSQNPRLIFVAGLSRMSEAAEAYFPTPPQPKGWPKKVDFETISYRCSKTALNMLMLDYNHKLKEDGVKVWSVGPGFLLTGLGNVQPERLKAMGAGHPSIGANVIKSVVEGERDADVGKIVGKSGLIPF